MQPDHVGGRGRGGIQIHLVNLADMHCIPPRLAIEQESCATSWTVAQSSRCREHPCSNFSIRATYTNAVVVIDNQEIHTHKAGYRHVKESPDQVTRIWT
ncbi:hypothetical protein WJX77_000714 [Trebouxia sp. C0004]